jgi:integrase
MNTADRSRRRRETPTKRINPSGTEVWIARYTDRHGRRPSAGTFKRKHEAQAAIDAAYAAEHDDGPLTPGTVGDYAETWTERHPRSSRTNKTNDGRLRAVLDVEIEGRRLRDWPFHELRRRHAGELVAHMLLEQGRAHTGAQNILRTLSAMAENAIDDDVAELNWIRGVRVRANDPRVIGETKPPRVFSFEQMHRLAVAGGKHEAMLRIFPDCGLRLGEVLGLARTDFDGETFSLRGSAHHGVFTAGDQPTKRHVRTVPVPPSTAALIRAMPRRIDTPVLFPTASGKIWHESNFRRDVWIPAVAAYLGLERRDGETIKAFRVRCRELLAESDEAIRPHDCRHSWITHLRAAGVDDADLAQMAGHTVDTMIGTYTHALGRSHDRVRGLIG